MKFTASKITTVCLAVGLLVQAAISAPLLLVIPGLPPSPTLASALWQSFQTATNGHTAATEFLNLGGDVTNIVWNTNSCLYGQSGFTAFSMEGNGYFFTNAGWGTPVTALTKRHVYARGHDMGQTNNVLDNHPYTSAAIHFLTADNQVVLRHALAAFNRQNYFLIAGQTAVQDYTLFLLDADLPDSIQPVTMVDTNFAAKLAKNTAGWWPNFNPELATCQHNQIGTLDGVSFNPHPFYVGGDSGSPNFYILNGAVVMVDGRTTSGWSPQMQADADALSVWGGLNPASYQIKLLDVSQFQ